MSLPTKQEVVQEAQTKGFSDRVKFGAKLGHQHAKNEKLSSFLSDLRSYEAPVAAQLDAASVEISKFLPMQQKSGAKHFDEEQVALAMATAAGDRATLENEIRGPGASHLTYACDRLCKITGTTEADVDYLFKMLVDLPEKRRKVFLKSLLKHRKVAVLDRYCGHLSSDKDFYAQLRAFLHGCSHKLVVQHFAELANREQFVEFYHLARYHAPALLEIIESQLKAAFGQENQTGSVWVSWNNYLCCQHGARGIDLLLASRVHSARLLELASQYPPLYMYSNTYYPTMPQLIMRQWPLFTKHHGDALFAFAQKCTYPLHSYHVFTFSLNSVQKREQIYQFLEVSIPEKVDPNVTEPDQISLPDTYLRAIGAFTKISYLPDVMAHMNKLVDWADRYSDKFPALKKFTYWIYSSIFTNAAGAVKRLYNQKVIDLEDQRLKALEQLRINGKHFSELSAQSLEKKLLDVAPYRYMIEAIYERFLPAFEEDVKAVYEQTGKLNHRVELRVNNILVFWSTIYQQTDLSLKATKSVLRLLNAYTFKSAQFQKPWALGLGGVLGNLRRFVHPSTRKRHLLVHSAEHVRYEEAASKEAHKLLLELITKHLDGEHDTRPFLNSIITQTNYQWSWAQLSDFWKLCKVQYFIELCKDKQEDMVISLLQSVPIEAAQPVLQALLEPKVCTPAQRTKLIPYLSVADAKNRKLFEQGTSSSSAPERAAALIRMTKATARLPFAQSEIEAYGTYLKDATATQAMLKEATATLSFIAKRIKNATFADRCIYQALAFDDEDFNTVWLAPGVGPEQFAVWLEMLDDHLQNPNHNLYTVEIENQEQYEDALSEYKFSPWKVQPQTLWTKLTSRAIGLGVRRNDDALLEFGFNVAAKIGVVEFGAGDPLGNRVARDILSLAGYMVSIRDPKRSDEIVTKMISMIRKFVLDPELKEMKELQLYRSMINAVPIAHLHHIPMLYKHLVGLYEKALASVQPLKIEDVLKPLSVSTGYEEEAEMEALAQEAILPTLVLKHPRRVYLVPVLVDYVFNVALKSWAAAGFVQVAWKTRLQTAFSEHRKAFTGPNKLYNAPKGERLRKFEMAVAEKFARELVAICPSALHMPRIQRIFAQVDPSLLFKHISNETENLDDIVDETEKLQRMQRAALLGPFYTSFAAPAAPAKAPVRGRRPRGARGATAIGETSLMERSVPLMTTLRDVIKKWKRGQSTKSADNTNYFLPMLCYGTLAWHADQVKSFGTGLYQAILNGMRPQAQQKKFVILWSLLPTTSYADIVTFLQQNDSSFQPSVEEESATEEDDNKMDVDEVSTPTPNPAAGDSEAEAAKVLLPLAIVESAIRGTTMNDEPLAPLPFLLSPTFLSSNYSRIAVQAVQSLMPYVPGGLLTSALSYLLKDHRKTLKTTAHKQIIRFLAEHVCLEHWDIFVSEWNHPKTHRDVRITLLNEAFSALNVAKGEVLDRVWQILEMATKHKEADVVCALLKAAPSQFPSRILAAAHYPFVLLNTRVKNQFQSLTETKIPTECAARYMNKIVLPLLNLDAGITGSDLQFLALDCIPRWSSYVNEANEGEPDYHKVCTILLSYLLKSLETDVLWVTDKKKERDVALARWQHVCSNFTKLLTFHPESLKRAEMVSNTNLKPSDYIIEGAAGLMSTLMVSLIKTAETLNQNEPVAPAPADQLRWRRLTNILDCLNHLVVSCCDLKVVAKKNATLEEQNTWLDPLHKSSFWPLFIEELTVVLLKQIEPLYDNMSAFFGAYHKLIEASSEHAKLRAPCYEAINGWIQELSGYGTREDAVGDMIKGLKDRLAHWATPTQAALDIKYLVTITSSLLTTASSCASLIETIIDFLELLLKLSSGIEVILPGFSHVITDAPGVVAAMLSRVVYPTYDVLNSARKRFMEWLVGRALEVQADFVAKSNDSHTRLSYAQVQYAKLWRQVLAKLGGGGIAKYVPHHARAILDAAAFEGPILDLTYTIIECWLNPDTVLVDPALAGYGNPGVDYEYAVRLLDDLIHVNLNPARSEQENKDLPVSYVLNVVQGAIYALENLPAAQRLLHLHKASSWWILFNESFIIDQTFPTFDEHSLGNRRLGSSFLLSAVTEAIAVPEAQVNVTPLVTLIKDLHECRGSLQSPPTIFRNLFPFAPVLAQYRERCQFLAQEILLKQGEALALSPPSTKGMDAKDAAAATTKKTWRPELLALAEEIMSTTTIAPRFNFAEQTLLLTSVMYKWPVQEQGKK